MFYGCTKAPAVEAITFQEKPIEIAIRAALKQPTGEITLKDLENVRQISLECNGIKDLDEMLLLKNLEIAYFQNIDNRQLQQILGMNTLKSLKIKTVEPLEITDGAIWENLQILSVDSKEVITLDGLKDYGSLEYLTIKAEAIHGIEGIASHHRLKELSLNPINHFDATYLENCPQLKRLNPVSGEIQNLEKLGSLETLEDLALISCAIEDISWISSLKNLKYLYLIDNKISEITGLEKLQHLEELDISQNQISDISPLAGLSHLKKLMADENPIENQLNP